jgi:hypothetical protein
MDAPSMDDLLFFYRVIMMSPSMFVLIDGVLR